MPSSTATSTSSTDCSGTYNCSSLSGQGNGTVVLSSSGGGSCSMKGTSFTVTSDNLIKQGNQSVGSWSSISGNVVATLNGASYTCNKTSTSTSGTTTLPLTGTTTTGTGGGAPTVDAGR